ncbi:hypothetical protein F4678DRAFT_418976 [Xylaria arbuscula]|nr:hypothetical protein F4678DRAFT_418976 [Xylaria arbuscula]
MSTTAELGHQRLLSDIHELITEPYPKIQLHPHERNLNRACLILYPDNYPPLHLTLSFPERYPILPPKVHMDSSVQHPNVFGGYICATILRVGDEYTPAYTLKGIAIQLLSFFDSDKCEQDYGNYAEDLTQYHELNSLYLVETYQCWKCKFGLNIRPRKLTPPPNPTSFDARVDQSPEQWPTIQNPSLESSLVHSCTSGETAPSQQSNPCSLQIPTAVNNHKNSRVRVDINGLPSEILLLIIESLDDFEHLTNFARAWPRISQIVRDFDVIRQRELQCFCLKKGYQSADLGVGVRVVRGQISSEFDLISKEAHVHLGVQQSIHNIPFTHWLPLPLSRRHWVNVREEAHSALTQIAPALKTPSSPRNLDAYVLFTFMNDIVVRLNQTTEKIHAGNSEKSTLRHASEKAIESYFHLFHLLVCLATENLNVVQQANKLLRDFQGGKTSKADCPNLGHLLIALLISDVQVTDTLIKSIITEAIVRNVVWLLDRRGAGMAELSYMERDAVSAYRLDKTFQGSRTSYRLLMFSELFRRTARPSHEKTLAQVRGELFDRHGGPPRDLAGHLAAEVRRLHTIDDFPAFMTEMGLKYIPTSANFTAVLRATVRKSMTRGYSKWAINQKQAMRLRVEKDLHVQVTKEERMSGTRINYKRENQRLSYNFFPK